MLADSNTVSLATQTALIDNISSIDGIHNAGDLHFGRDGLLYVSVGDSGCDFKTFTSCGSKNTNARDQSILNGKVLRITKDGAIPPGNPFQGADSARCNAAGHTDAGKKCQETFAWGLRNPYRISFDPNTTGTTTRFFINDVGQNVWEEIDEAVAGADYGWNVREGHCKTGSTTDCGLQPAGMTNPVYDYPHGSGCTAVTAGAFVPNGLWPAAFDNTYLYGDFVCGKIIRLTPANGGGFTSSDFATGMGTNSATGMQFGPMGSSQALYYTSYLNGGELRRVVFTGTANRAPTARIGASPASGPLPLSVSFDASTSSDPDGDPLSYDCSFGDGSAHSAAQKPSHVYTSAGAFTATLTVSDGKGGSDTKTVRIDAGNRAPVPVIDAPAEGTTFAVGQVLTLTGHATDPDQAGNLPDSALSWVVIKHHNTHVHPFFPATAGNNLQIPPGPDPEALDAVNSSSLEIQLTATDPQGLSTTVTRIIKPHVVNLSFATTPPGLRLEVNGQPLTTPAAVPSWEKYGLLVNAPDQSAGATAYRFAGWSDAGALAHHHHPGGAGKLQRQLQRLPVGEHLRRRLRERRARRLDQRQRAHGAGPGGVRRRLRRPRHQQRRPGLRHQAAGATGRARLLPALQDPEPGRQQREPGKAAHRDRRRRPGLLPRRQRQAGVVNETTAQSRTSSGVVSAGAWHLVGVHVLLNGGSGLSEVFLDGARIGELGRTESLGTTPIGRIQLGDNQSGRSYDVAYDDVAVTAQPAGGGATRSFPAAADPRVQEAAPDANFGSSFLKPKAASIRTSRATCAST